MELICFLLVNPQNPINSVMHVYFINFHQNGIKFVFKRVVRKSE